MYCVYFYSEDARYKNIHYPARAGNIKRQENVYEQDYQFTGRISLQCRKDRILVTIILTNGFQFKGMVRGFDSYVAIFDCDGKQQLVYKHAISTIIPARSVSILDAADKGE